MSGGGRAETRRRTLGRRVNEISLINFPIATNILSRAPPLRPSAPVRKSQFARPPPVFLSAFSLCCPSMRSQTGWLAGAQEEHDHCKH